MNTPRGAKGAARPQRAPVRTSREEIKEKALELFLKRGYHGTSTSDICQALGISRPTLYWYFKDKEDLLFSLHFEKLETKLKPILARVKEIEDPLEALRTFIRELTQLVCTEPESKVLIKETEYLAAEHVDWVKGVWKEQFEVVRGAIRSLHEAGKAKEVPPSLAALTLIGMISWAYNWFDASRPGGIPELARTIEEIFLGGLLIAGPSEG